MPRTKKTIPKRSGNNSAGRAKQSDISISSRKAKRRTTEALAPKGDSEEGPSTRQDSGRSGHRRKSNFSSAARGSKAGARARGLAKKVATSKGRATLNGKKRKTQRRGSTAFSSSGDDDSDSLSVEVLPSAPSSRPSEERDDYSVPFCTSDQWYEDYYTSEVNVADDTLLDILVDTIKQHCGQDAPEGFLRPWSSGEKKSTSSAWRRRRHEADTRAVKEELRSLTSNAFLVKKAWAFVTEDSANTRKKMFTSAQERKQPNEKAEQAPAAQTALQAEGEASANIDADEGKHRSDVGVSLRLRWEQFVKQRKERLEIEGRVRKECEALEVAEQTKRKERHQPRGQSSCAVHEGGEMRDLTGQGGSGFSLGQGREGTSLPSFISLSGEKRLVSESTQSPLGRPQTAGHAPVQSEDEDHRSYSSSAPSVCNASSTTCFSSSCDSSDRRGGFTASQMLLAASDAVSFHHAEPPRDEASEEEIAESFLLKVTKSPSAGSSSPSYSSSSSTSSDESSYSPTSCESDGEDSSDEDKVEAQQPGPLQYAVPESTGAPPSENPVDGLLPKSAISRDGTGQAALTEEADTAAAEATAPEKAFRRRRKNRMERSSGNLKRSKSIRVRRKKRGRSRVAKKVSRTAGVNAGGSTLATGMYSGCTTFSSWSQLSSSSRPPKGVHVPKTMALRPHCIYFFESSWEKELHTRYPNGMLRRGTICVDVLSRVDETLEFFLFCRFLNLFASVLDVSWTFQDLVEGFSCSAGAASSCPDTNTCGAYPSGDSGRSSANAGGGPAGGGNKEEGTVNAALRKIITKLFHFLGRRITPGMSLTRMCGRYVEDKRREGVLPAGLLWPFDYSVKVWQPLDSASKADVSKKKKRENLSGNDGESEASQETNKDVERGEKKFKGSAGEAQKEQVRKQHSGDAGHAVSEGVEGVLMESCYNPFKVCDDWQQLKSVHDFALQKLRVVRLLMENALSESPHFIKAMKSKNEESLQSGCKGPDAVGRLYWIVPQCGDITVFKLYREDPKKQKLEILCEDMSSLESVAEALSMDETTTMMTSRLLSAHQQMLLQEKQKSRELRRQKALSRQLEISNWGCVASAGQKRDRKPVDYTFAAYEASIEGKGVLARGAALLSPPSHPETQRHDRSERLRARQAKKEELETVTAVEAIERDRGDRVREGRQILQTDGSTQARDERADSDLLGTRPLTVVGDCEARLESDNATSRPRKRQSCRTSERPNNEADVLRNKHQAFLAAQHENVSAALNLRTQQEDKLLMMERRQQSQHHQAMPFGQDTPGGVGTHSHSPAVQMAFHSLPSQAPAQQYLRSLQTPTAPIQRLSPVDVAAMQQQLLQVREALARSTLSLSQKEEAYRNVWLHLSNKYMGVSSNGYSVPVPVSPQVPQSTPQTTPAVDPRTAGSGIVLSAVGRDPPAASQQATAAAGQCLAEPSTVASLSMRSRGDFRFDTQSQLQVDVPVDPGGMWGVHGRVQQQVATTSAFQRVDSQMQSQEGRSVPGGLGQVGQQQRLVQQQQLDQQKQLLDSQRRESHLRAQQLLLEQRAGALR